jgi:hypothetical protein
MSVLEDAMNALAALDVPAETGAFSGTPPDKYIVLTPLADIFSVYADNRPQLEIQEVRLSLFTKGSYTGIRNQVLNVLMNAGLTITGRLYAGHEDDTGYHHYVIDVSKDYRLGE